MADANPATTLPDSPTPSASLIGELRAVLVRHAPFSAMASTHVDEFIRHAREAYFAPGEVVLSPGSGPVHELHVIRTGTITGEKGVARLDAGGIEYEAGDLFPVSAVLGERPVTATYTARADTFCLLVPAEAVRRIALASAPFADALNRRVAHLLELSRRALQSAYSSQALVEQSMERPLGELVRGEPRTCAPATPLRDALAAMHQHRIGSIVVVDGERRPVGIFTRFDVLGRVALAGVPMDEPIAGVMSAPVHTLGAHDTAQDAALLMSRHGLRHVPVTGADGRLTGVISERDLFVMQRLSLNNLSTALRSAVDVAALKALAADIRAFARNLVGQGVQAKQLTQLISHLNDVLTERLIELKAAQHGRDMTRACWLAFGSEGRGEQTIATDQDNGLIFESDAPAADRPVWLAFARDVNEALDECGYPLCKGNVMASNPECCLTPTEWRARFAQWIDQGSPEDLLAANIYFDFRALTGHVELAQPLREFVTARAQDMPRFCKQLGTDMLRNRPPLAWHGGLDTTEVDGRDSVDLKLNGTAIFVDAARLLSLAAGIGEVGTRRRLEAIARAARGLSEAEAEGSASAFEYLQMLRLRAQLDNPQGLGGNPNVLDVATLNDIDRRILKEAFRAARRLQQRIELDYMR
jgi:CBS domain-containing protein